MRTNKFPQAENRQGSSRLTEPLLWLVLLTLFLIQVTLVFAKSINWDEFLHFSLIYDLRAGRLIWNIQTLQTRLFAWATYLPFDVIGQLQAARMLVLAFEVVAVVMVVKFARLFVPPAPALLAGIAYLGSGYTLMHGFSYRPDAMAAATLMTALYLLVRRKLTLPNVVTVGLLVGVAGMLTIKSAFYFPCFAGIAWYRLVEHNEDRLAVASRLALVPIAAALTFCLLFILHGTGIAGQEGATQSIVSRVQNYLSGNWFELAKFTIWQAVTAPLFTIAVIVTPFTWDMFDSRTKVLLSSLLVPLLTLVFYRNTFPYYFVFLLAPVAVAIAPALSWLVQRFGLVKFVALALATSALHLWLEPFGVLERQRAVLREIHRLFPEPTGYLAYTGFVADYPRIIPHLISGIGYKQYIANEDPVIERHVTQGDVGFVLADSRPVALALAGKRLPGGLLDRDAISLRENFIHYRNVIWIAGKELCPGQNPQTVEIYRSGPYTLDGGGAIIDGRPVANGQSIDLNAGTHFVRHQRNTCLKIWALPEIPRPPKTFPTESIMTGF